MAFGLTLAHFDRCMHLFDVFNGGTNGLYRCYSDAVPSISDLTPCPSSMVSQCACGPDYLIQCHQFHDAGNDAHITMLDMIQMLLLFVGGSSPGVLGTKNCPIYVTIDFEDGALEDTRSVHNRTKKMTITKRTTTSKKWRYVSHFEDILLNIEQRNRIAAANARILKNYRNALGAPIVTLPRFGKTLFDHYGFSVEPETPGPDLASPSSALV